MKTYVVVNPNSAGGATMKRWPRLSEKLEKKIGRFDYDFTNASGVAGLLAGEAVKKGYEKIISVGGDGTIFEVIQGLFDRSGNLINPDILVGILPSGTGVDIARTLKLPNDPEEIMVKLRGREARKIDIGMVHFKDHKGKGDVRYFINMSDVGLGGEVAERANNSTKVLGGFATYLFSSFVSFVSYKPKNVRIKADDKLIEESVTSVFIANGPFYGGGMVPAPGAKNNDGYFDVVVLGKISKWDLVTLTPKLYSGKMFTLPMVNHFRAKKVSIESDEDVLINLDGEQPGTTPVSYTILPGVLNFMA